MPSLIATPTLLFTISLTLLTSALPIPDKSTCIGSSFAPTNCNSPGAQSINVDPALDLSPDVSLPSINVRSSDEEEQTLETRQDKSTCVGSSFSPTNCDSPGAQSINVDPDVDVSPDVSLPDVDLSGLGLGGLLGGRDAVEEVQKSNDDEEEEQYENKETCVGSSFSATNCDSPGAQSVNVKPDVEVSPEVDGGDVSA